MKTLRLLRSAGLAAMLALALPAAAPLARAIELPPSCAGVAAPAVGGANGGADSGANNDADSGASIAELRQRVTDLDETDPQGAFALLCATWPRVVRETGAESLETAWWTAAFATPLIAYMDKFDEALPLLRYAQPILEKEYGPLGEPLGDIHVAYAWTYFRQGRLEDADRAWHDALRVREKHPGEKKIELQKILVGLAQVQLTQRKFRQAQQTLERAHAILVENQDTVSEAGAAIENALANATLRQERFELARAHAQEQLRIEEQLKGGAAQLVPAYALLGRILERQDEFEQAEQSLRRGLELSEGAQGPLQRHHFVVLFQLAALLDERDRSAEARAIALRALSIGEATLGPDAPRLVPVLQVLGDAERKLGELPDALHHFERAGAIVARRPADVERPWQVDYFRDFGALQMSLGDIEAAERTMATGLAAAGTDPTLSVARARLLLDHARARAALGRSGSAAELREAERLLRTRLPDTHPSILRVINARCSLEIDASEASLHEAPDCDAAGQRLDRRGEIPPALRASVFANRSRLALRRGDRAAAFALALRGLAAAESAGLPETLWRAHFQLARVLHEQQDGARAVFFGKEAVAQIERERSFFAGPDQRFDRGFLRDKVSVYRDLADWLMEAGRIDEGLAVLRRMKSEEVSDFGVRDATVPGEHGIDLTVPESELRKRYLDAVQVDGNAALELSQLGSLQEQGRISPAERARLGALLQGSQRVERLRSERIASLLRTSGPRHVGPLAQRAPLDAPILAQTAASFGTDAAFAVYLLGRQHLRIFVSTAHRQAEFEVAIDEPALQRDIGHYLDQIGRREQALAASRHLYDILARPVDAFAQANGVHRLVVWLDGPLRYVPVAALNDGHADLVDKYAIQLYAPARAVAAAHPDGLAPRVRGLGVTRAVGGFAALPAMAEELCAIVRGPISGLTESGAACPDGANGAGALEGEGYADGAFTEERLRRTLAPPLPYSVLHIGTHFRLRPGNALRSFLLLGDGTRLTLGAMDSLDFTGMELVTLSACETGAGGARADDGHEVEGLSTLVQRRGAEHVMASLWQVEDRSTAQLMSAFYSAYTQDHQDAALGLRQAQVQLRATEVAGAHPYAAPYYWAGFFVSGDQP